MAGKKQMMDIDKKTSMTAALSDEHQRNWDKEQADRKAADPTRNYDPSRFRLNFQVGRGGVIQEVDRSRNIVDKIEARIKEGVTPGHVIRNTSHRSVNIVFGGNRERMLELAFGGQKIGEAGTNGSVERRPEIEEWARDIYDFCCREFGEDNIVSFIVHLDELNPHAHCVTVPITPDGRLSAKDVFGGKTLPEAQKRLKDMHTRLAAVNERWGLDRGDDIRETGARHISLDEHHRLLSKENRELEQKVAAQKKMLEKCKKEIAQKNTAIKGLETMSSNLQGRIDGYRAELAELSEQKNQNLVALDVYNKRKAELEEKIDESTEKYNDKQQKLEQKRQELKQKRQELDGLEQEIHTLKSNMLPYTMLKLDHTVPQIKGIPPIMGREEWVRNTNAALRKQFDAEIKKVENAYAKCADDKIKAVWVNKLADHVELRKLRSDSDALAEHCRDLADDLNLTLLALGNSGLSDVARSMAQALFDGSIPPQSGVGGGGSAPGLRWDGRKEDESDEEYRARCLMTACRYIRMVHTQKRKMRR